MFPSVAYMKQTFAFYGYVALISAAAVVFLALALNSPMFVFGFFLRDIIALARVMLGNRDGNSGRYRHWQDGD